MRCIAVAASTIDGKIAHDSDHPSEWTSPEDKTFLHEFLKSADVVVIGTNTYKTAPNFFAHYNCVVLSSHLGEAKRESERLLLCNPKHTDVRKLLSQYATVAVLGGTQTYTYFLEHDLLDEIYLTVEPLVFGRGLQLFESSHNSAAHFRLASHKKLNDKGSLLLHYTKV
jgi:dihydrofolate reductase